MISIRSHFCKLSWRDWQPLYRVGCEVLVCLCRCMGLLRGLLLVWYLGSQKLREIITVLSCITLSSSREKPTHAQEVVRRISGAVAGEVFAQVKTYQVPITNSSPSHFTLAVLFALSFPIFSPFRLSFVCSSIWLVLLSSLLLPNMKFLILSKGEGGENLKDTWHRICNAQNRSTRKLSTSVLLRNFYVGITPWNRCILDTITGGNFWIAIPLMLIMLC